MDERQKKIIDFLQKLGLSLVEAKIYLTLCEYGELTTLQISKILSLPRTSLYRVLEKLQRSGFVEEIIDAHRSRMRSVDIAKIEAILLKRNDEIKKLQRELPEVSSLLPLKQAMKQPQTKVLFYRGEEGMKQLLWNLLRTKEIFRGFAYCTPVETVGPELAVEWALEWNKRELKGRDLYSDNYILSAKKHPYPTPIAWESWESRYLNPQILNIDHQIDIYNDVVAYYSWHEGEIFGVEIYNRKVANLQKQIFDVLWKMGEKKNYEL